MKNEISSNRKKRLAIFFSFIVLFAFLILGNIEQDQESQVEKMLFPKNARITFNPITKIPSRVMNLNIIPAELKETKAYLSKKNVERVLKSFLESYFKVFKVKPKTLKLISTKRRKGKWYIKLQQYYRKVPVYDAVVSFIVTDQGMINTYGSSYYPKIEISINPKIDLEKAVKLAKRTYKKKIAKNLTVSKTMLFIYPVEKKREIKFYLAWKFLLAPKRPDPEIEEYFIIDALTGKIIRNYLARFPGTDIKGKVRGEIYPENPTTPPISTESLSHTYVYVRNNGRVQTNNNGRYYKDLPWWYIFMLRCNVTFRLEGPYSRVQDNTGNDYTFDRECWITSPCSHTWTAVDRDHINVFYHMNLIHDWYESRFSYTWVNAWDGTGQFHAEVNHPDNNAYAGDPMVFGVNCFARSSDIIYHECTHNVLFDIFGNWIGWPNRFDESYAMDEGFADYFASSMTEDSLHGEGCGNPRDLDNTDQYPGKDVYNIEGHTGGEIIGGAAWDLREMLIDRMGQVSGSRYADNLVFDALFHMATFPRDYFFSDPQESNLLTSLYFADDDNNNLLDGVPHFHQIHRAFHNHDLLQAVLLNRNSYDVSINSVGTLSEGDFYFSGGSFFANNFGQRGVIDLGDIGVVPLDQVQIPLTGYTRFGVTATNGNTYVSLAQQGEEGSYIVFRVTDISAANDEVVLEYLYRTPLLIEPIDFCWRYPEFCRKIYFCDKYPFLCEPRIILIEKEYFVVDFRHELDRIVIPVDRICHYVLDCPGCGPSGLCPGYEMFFVNMPDTFGVEIYNSKGKPIVRNLKNEKTKKIQFRTQKNEMYFLVISPSERTKIKTKYKITIKGRIILK